jgi:hypothetical protein
MMLFDPKVGLSIKEGNVSGRQGRGIEIMSATVKQRKKQIGGMLPGVRPEKGHLALEVIVANDIACDHVWDKLYPPPSHFCNLF